MKRVNKITGQLNPVAQPDKNNAIKESSSTNFFVEDGHGYVPTSFPISTSKDNRPTYFLAKNVNLSIYGGSKPASIKVDSEQEESAKVRTYYGSAHTN